MEIVVNTNNGVERKNRDFKYEFLRPYKDNTLSGMITVLVEQFIPETYDRYVSVFFQFFGVRLILVLVILHTYF